MLFLTWWKTIILWVNLVTKILKKTILKLQPGWKGSNQAWRRTACGSVVINIFNEAICAAFNLKPTLFYYFHLKISLVTYKRPLIATYKTTLNAVLFFLPMQKTGFIADNISRRGDQPNFPLLQCSKNQANFAVSLKNEYERMCRYSCFSASCRHCHTGSQKVSQTAQIFVRARSLILLYSSPQDRLSCAQLFLLHSREHYAPERFTTFGENQQSGPLFQPDWSSPPARNAGQDSGWNTSRE